MNGLWRDPNLMNVINSDMPDNVRVEAIEKGRRTHDWGAGGLNGEKPYAELQYTATAMYRAEYGAIVTDDFLHLHQESVWLKKDGTVPDASEVQRIITEYEFNPAKETANDGER
jgi:hypothetical protein